MSLPYWKISFSSKFSKHLEKNRLTPLDKWILAHHIIVWRQTKKPFRGIDIEKCCDKHPTENYVLIGIAKDGLGNNKLELLLEQNTNKKELTIIFARRL